MGALAAELSAAADGRDWPRLQAAARALPARLSELAGRGAFSAAEQQALALLRAAHDRAASAVARAARETQAVLDEMHNNKEGWMAYALNGAEPAVNEQ
jgi:hypothetical protein